MTTLLLVAGIVVGLILCFVGIVLMVIGLAAMIDSARSEEG